MHKQREKPGEEQLCKNCMNIIWPAHLSSVPRRNCSHPASCNFRGSLVSGSTEENRKSRVERRMENRVYFNKVVKTPTLESLANNCVRIEELKRYVYFWLAYPPIVSSIISPPSPLPTLFSSFLVLSFFSAVFVFPFFFFVKQEDKTSLRREEKLGTENGFEARLVWMKE